MDCHSPVESRRALLQDHGLLQVSFFPGNICQILSFLLHHFRILGFYASGFILIVISLDRYVEIIFISNKEHTRYPPHLFSEDSKNISDLTDCRQLSLPFPTARTHRKPLRCWWLPGCWLLSVLSPRSDHTTETVS